MEKIPFNKDAFVNGAIALDDGGHEHKFEKYYWNNEAVFFSGSGPSICQNHFEVIERLWSMKPTTPEETDDGECVLFDRIKQKFSAKDMEIEKLKNKNLQILKKLTTQFPHLCYIGKNYTIRDLMDDLQNGDSNGTV